MFSGFIKSAYNTSLNISKYNGYTLEATAAEL